MSVITYPSTLDELLRLDRVSFDERHRLPRTSGIYFVLYGDGVTRLAYIGKAKSIERRWAGHHRLPELHLLNKLGIPTGIAWVGAEEDDLEELEHRLIGLFTPPLNDGPTLTRLRERAVPALKPITSDEIVGELRKRQGHALPLLVSEEMWDVCNGDERGDCLSLWPFTDAADLVEIDMQWAFPDNHDLTPYRVVTPPAFAANKSGRVEPKEGFEASWAERFEWTLEIARQVDAFLFSIATFHGAASASGERQRLFAALAGVETLESKLRADPEMLAKGSVASE